MKKMICTIIAGILLLSACQSGEPKKASEVKSTSERPQRTVEMKKDGTFPYQNLLAETDQSYSLLVIGEQEEQTPIEDDQKIRKAVTNILSLPTLEMVEKIYPKLPIDEQSAYILFDNSGVIHQSKNLKELKSFLEKNPLN
ncbi:hypothetical protein [Bacillus sp. UNC41MFS5]|uniref:hypothetical protein n=1 Tax=Bacillus sp. UNC41MFS5 TaxID=1449046 RepID=UPI00047B0587|nr:hypothetical protein [Bacillus sp. UNC41MFS5]